MRGVLASLMLVVIPAWAQVPAPAAIPEKAAATCTECAVVRSVRMIAHDIGSPNTTEGKPSGLVATIPFGGGKPQVGSSSKIGADKIERSQRWEITVRFDDGRYRIVNVDAQPEFKEGDKVRIDAQGQIKRRD